MSAVEEAEKISFPEYEFDRIDFLYALPRERWSEDLKKLVQNYFNLRDKYHYSENNLRKVYKDQVQAVYNLMEREVTWLLTV